MPITYRIDHEAKVVRIRGSGTLTNDELVSCIIRLREDPELPFGMPAISDLRDVAVLEVTLEGFQQVADVIAATDEQRGPARAALVVDKEGDLMMAKLYTIVGQSANSQTSFKVFKDLAEAEAWLGLGEN